MSTAFSTGRTPPRKPRTWFCAGFAVVAWAGLFAFAFVAAPVSCEWGLSAYCWAGVAVLLVVAGLPFVVPGGCLLRSRLLTALLLGAASVAVWAAGLFAADVRILCRLF